MIITVWVLVCAVAVKENIQLYEYSPAFPKEQEHECKEIAKESNYKIDDLIRECDCEKRTIEIIGEQEV